jgi:hypothetical protein
VASVHALNFMVLCIFVFVKTTCSIVLSRCLLRQNGERGVKTGFAHDDDDSTDSLYLIMVLHRK